MKKTIIFASLFIFLFPVISYCANGGSMNLGNPSSYVLRLKGEKAGRFCGAVQFLGDSNWDGLKDIHIMSVNTSETLYADYYYLRGKTSWPQKDVTLGSSGYDLMMNAGFPSAVFSDLNQDGKDVMIAGMPMVQYSGRPAGRALGMAGGNGGTGPGADNIYNKTNYYLDLSNFQDESFLTKYFSWYRLVDATSWEAIVGTYMRSATVNGKRKVMIATGGYGIFNDDEAPLNNDGQLFIFNGDWLTSTTETLALHNLTEDAGSDFLRNKFVLRGNSTIDCLVTLGCGMGNDFVVTMCGNQIVGGDLTNLRLDLLVWKNNNSAFRIVAPGALTGFGPFVDVGDFNGDGNDDIVTTFFSYPAGGGSATSAIYVFFGPFTQYSSNWQSVAATSMNYMKFTAPSHDIFWNAMFDDFNNDGIKDIFAVSPITDNVASMTPPYIIMAAAVSGEAYCILGSSEYTAGTTKNLSDSSSYDLKIVGSVKLGGVGAALGSSFGDVDGDGFKDILLSEPLAPEIGSYSGAMGASSASPSQSMMLNPMGFMMNLFLGKLNAPVKTSGAGQMHASDAEDFIPFIPASSGYTYLITTGATVELTSHQGGQNIGGGSTQTITWRGGSCLPITDVSIYYSIDSGRSYNLIASGVPNTGMYSWTVPNITSSLAKIKVEFKTALGTLGSDQSRLPFTITATGPIIKQVEFDGVQANYGDEVSSSPLISANVSTNSALKSIEVKMDDLTVFTKNDFTNETSYNLDYQAQSFDWSQGSTHTMRILASDSTGTTEYLLPGLKAISELKALTVSILSPVSDSTVRLSYQLTHATEKQVDILITNLASGRVVKRVTLNPGEVGTKGGVNDVVIILSSDLSSGPYYAVAVSGDTKLLEKKFIIVK